MKARVKATGEIVEVGIDYNQDADYIAPNGQLYWQGELDFINLNIKDMREEIENNIGYKMTRAALGYVEKHEFADAIDAFEAGAEWMQEIMIEKATQWLFENVYDYLNPEDQERVESFRKYLEE